MLKITRDTATIAREHRLQLEPKLQKRFQNLKQRIISDQNIQTAQTKAKSPKGFEPDFFTPKLLDSIENYLKANTGLLLESKPEELLKFSNEYNAKKSTCPPQEPLYKGIEYIFNYESFSESETPWNAYSLVSALQVTVCPYCNRNYIFTVNKSGKEKGARPELDHFFCQDDHPILSVSFYNLIPSCHTCNHTKSNAKFQHDLNLHPYLDGVNIKDLIFDFDATCGSAATIKSEDITIRMPPLTNPTLRDKFEANKKAFILDKIYSFHKDNAARIIKLSAWYDDTYRASLKKLININSDDDIDHMIIGTRFTQDDLLNQPLSKFNHDIFQQCKSKSTFQRNKQLKP